MSPSKEAPLKNISDTAFWVATYRAMESKRADALFKDPYAELLSGEQGKQIVNNLGSGARNSWFLVARTCILDSWILKLIETEKIDTVLNLAAGLDTRAYRLKLPSSLRWYDVDLPFLDDTVLATPSYVGAGKNPVEGADEYAQIIWEIIERGKIDFLELFSGSARASAACSSSGLRVGQPIDLKTGFDLNTRSGQKKAVQIILEQEPSVVFMAPLCSPWSSWSNMKTPKDRWHDRQAAMPMVDFCVQVAMHQIKHGRHFILENPERSAIFHTAIMLRLQSQSSVNYLVFDHCEFGMRDPVSKKYYKKGTCLLHNFSDGVLSPLERRCSGKHQHEPVEGSLAGYGNRSKLSQVYTFSFCKRVASCLQRFLNTPCGTRQSYLVSDLLEIGGFTDENIQYLCGLCQQHDVLVGTGNCVDALSTVVDQLPALTTDTDTRQRMTVVNALPQGTDIHLHYDWSTLHDALVPDRKSTRLNSSH